MFGSVVIDKKAGGWAENVKIFIGSDHNGENYGAEIVRTSAVFCFRKKGSIEWWQLLNCIYDLCLRWLCRGYVLTSLHFVHASIDFSMRKYLPRLWEGSVQRYENTKRSQLETSFACLQSTRVADFLSRVFKKYFTRVVLRSLWLLVKWSAVMAANNNLQVSWGTNPRGG